jgi:hypothetical protein
VADHAHRPHAGLQGRARNRRDPRPTARHRDRVCRRRLHLFPHTASEEHAQPRRLRAPRRALRLVRGAHQPGAGGGATPRGPAESSSAGSRPPDGGPSSR